MIEDDPHMLADPAGSLALLRKLGARVVRVFVVWSSVAPDSHSKRAPKFDAEDPNAYPAKGWAPYDAIDVDAKKDGITVDFMPTGGSPLWAQQQRAGGQQCGSQPKGYNPNFAWCPNASEYGQFVYAVGKRYSGTFPRGSTTPLPRVSFWTIFNEPNFGEDLGPQAVDGSKISLAPNMYRQIVNAGWSGLVQTGHTTRTDTILIGELASRGLSAPASKALPQGLPGSYSQTKPLIFIRTLYCVDGSYHQLRGKAASNVGCPTTAAGYRSFPKSNPGLFKASGFGIHPYPLAEGQSLPPNTDGPHGDPNYVAFNQLPNLWHELDRLQAMYGSGARFPIYNDEYGYITTPPHPPDSIGKFVSPATAAYYINWAEYLSYKWPRVVSFMQYPVWDPGPNPGVYQGFSAGLLKANGTKKPEYDAYRLPLYLPVTSAGRRRSLEVWGDARPAPFAKQDTGTTQSVQIQYQAGSRGSFKTVSSVRITNSQGYFDVHVSTSKFRAGSGTIRLAWAYPKFDPNFAANAVGATVYSRSQKITVR